MSQEGPKQSGHQVMTVVHGRQIYDKAVEISEKIEELKPLLELLAPVQAEEGTDPIAYIMSVLENLSIQGQHEIAELQAINAKLDLLLAGTDTGAL